MSWWKTSRTIPYSDGKFQAIICGFVFECPACNRFFTKLENSSKKEMQYKPVSARHVSFKARGITGHFLTTILAQIRKPLMRSNTYAVVKPGESVEQTVKAIIKNSSCSDDNFELIVYQTRTDMPDSEAVYFYIRNAFAHGAFEIINNEGTRIFLLESKKNDVVKAQMRLREGTLIRYIEFANLTKDEIRNLQRRKKD